MEDILKISVVAIISVILSIIISEKTPAFGVCLTVVTGTIIIGITMTSLQTVYKNLEELMELSGVTIEIFSPVIKVCIISIITKITSDICKDAKQTAIGQKVQFAGSIASIIAVFPLFTRIINILKEIL